MISLPMISQQQKQQQFKLGMYTTKDGGVTRAQQLLKMEP